MSDERVWAYPEFVHQATEELCQRQPLAARTRVALLRLEKEVHRAGWDSPASLPTILRFERHRTKHFVKAMESEPLTACLTLAYTRHTDGDVGKAMELLAWVTERGREAFSYLGVPLDEDVMRSDGGPGWEFYGYGLRMEGWTLPALGLDAVPEAVREKRIHEHPDRVETRMVYLVARDGLSWSLVRRRRMPPVECVVTRPEGQFEQLGLVVNALGRMTNAAAGNPVPVPRLAEEVIGHG